MTLKTHGTTSLSLGFMLSSIYANYANNLSSSSSGFSLGVAGAIVLGTFAGGMLHDFDHNESNLYSDYADMHWEDALEHRGPVHTLFYTIGVNIPFAIIYTILTMITSWNLTWLIALSAGLSIGCVWHLFEDSLTPKGVMWLWPITIYRFRIPIIKNIITEKIFEIIVSTIFLAISISL